MNKRFTHALLIPRGALTGSSGSRVRQAIMVARPLESMSGSFVATRVIKDQGGSL